MRHAPTPGMFRTPEDLAVFAVVLIGLTFVAAALSNLLGI